MVGAYTKIPVTDPAVKQCQTLIQKYFDKLKMNVKLVKVTDAYSQVVAGVNYKIIGAVNNNAKTENWQFIIYKDLKQNMRVTSAQNLTK